MRRIEKARELFETFDIDALLVTSSSNRFYLSGFKGSSGVLLITKEDAILVTDFRYKTQAAEQAEGYRVVMHTAPIPQEIAKLSKELSFGKLGFEQDNVTYSTYRTYENQLNTDETELVPVTGLIEKLRLIKDESEIKIVKDAASIADAAFSHIIEFIRPGLTEREVSNELEFFMRKNGATSSSFDIIVASGYRSALPHGVASDKIIETGELVTLDFGAYYKGYCSDITRTVAIGSVSDELKEIYQVVYDAQMLGMKGIRPGMTGKEADALTRDYIVSKGYGDYFGHSTGHGIGLDVHEGPALSMKSDTILEPGMLVTVEPGIYVSGLGGVRIEDDALITKDGNESLTSSTKSLLTIS
ncbi:M24 family metallopeptidase [Fictibacillus barbaricus]|uniref:Aminopeptidase P family protein n=1 Tax=Fictibacillus barbaricus TaxID=182136 RepID=A0ABS2ZJ53_9BACL|nr:Xaa-Pro peptidase family protein [Fictibacillus barbaricus]MBN3547692.1 aminopeptidase P family protein [Fictibacillus barbaricus]GGB50827.1 peptidase M24 [Fictibacillus barbaricus]